MADPRARRGYGNSRPSRVIFSPAQASTRVTGRRPSPSDGGLHRRHGDAANERACSFAPSPPPVSGRSTDATDDLGNFGAQDRTQRVEAADPEFLSGSRFAFRFNAVLFRPRPARTLRALLGVHGPLLC